MASARQIAANRLNARKSTGPRTIRGKARSRRNALRHGLTAHTVIDVFEKVEDYEALERQIANSYRPSCRLERELVCRLASLLWRLRRALSIETELLRLQGGDLGQANDAYNAPRPSLRLLTSQPGFSNNMADSSECTAPSDSRRRIAECFLRLSNRCDGPSERLGRYETSLWRQTMQTICLLETIRTKKAISGAMPG